MNADFPTLFREGSPESFGGKLESCRSCSRQGNAGAKAPLRAKAAGHYVLGAASCDAEGAPPLCCDATQSDSWVSQGKVEHVWPTDSGFPNTTIRKYGSAIAFRTTTFYEIAILFHAKVVVDVGIGYCQRNDSWRACLLGRKGD